MFKLKIINKPKMIKMKCDIEFPDVVLANLQEKEVIPTKEIQQIIADQQYDGLSKVVVNAIPDEYIIPNGDINIIENGTYDVTDKASAKVNIKEKVLGTKTITKNGTYKASDDDLDGYSEVEVATTGVDINDYYLTSGGYETISGYIKKIPQLDTSSVTNMNSMFNGCRNLISIPQLNTSNVTNMSNMFNNCKLITTIPPIDTSNVTYMAYMFASCNNLISIPLMDTSKVTGVNSMFYSCGNLISIPQLNLSKATNMWQMFLYCSALTTLGGFQNLGMAYDTSKSANYSYYTLDLSNSTKLTHDSLMNVINGLYDIKTKGCNPQSLVLGSTNISKLSAEEVAIGTERGWNIS